VGKKFTSADSIIVPEIELQRAIKSIICAKEEEKEPNMVGNMAPVPHYRTHYTWGKQKR